MDPYSFHIPSNSNSNYKNLQDFKFMPLETPLTVSQNYSKSDEMEMEFDEFYNKFVQDLNRDSQYPSSSEVSPPEVEIYKNEEEEEDKKTECNEKNLKMKKESSELINNLKVSIIKRNNSALNEFSPCADDSNKIILHVPDNCSEIILIVKEGSHKINLDV